MKKIIHNRGRCRICQTVIESKHVHDFVSCKCGAVSVDGGHEYLRRVGDIHLFEDLSEVEEVKEKAKSEITVTVGNEHYKFKISFAELFDSVVLQHLKDEIKRDSINVILDKGEKMVEKYNITDRIYRCKNRLASPIVLCICGKQFDLWDYVSSDTSGEDVAQCPHCHVMGIIDKERR